MFESLRERFTKQERCAEPSCTEDGRNFQVGKKVYPPDRAEIGRAAWRYVHARAENFNTKDAVSEASWLRSFIALFPCKHCAHDFLEICTRLPPNFLSTGEYVQWWRDAHNAVNRDLGKPKF